MLPDTSARNNIHGTEARFENEAFSLTPGIRWDAKGISQFRFKFKHF